MTLTSTTMAPYVLIVVFVMGTASSSCTGTETTLSSSAASFRGELASYVVNRGARTEIEHRLRTPDGRLRGLLFAEPIDIPPGTALRVWGREVGEAIRVSRFEIDRDAAHAADGTSSFEAGASALIGGPAKPTRKWAFVLLDIDGGGNPIDKTVAQSVLFGADRTDSIRSYFREVSHGIQDLEGEVFGPIPYQMGGRCDTDRVAQTLVSKIPGRFDQYLWFFGTQQAACNWAGIAELGRADRPTRHSWYNSFHSCTVLVQEPGHNFGMVHSSAMRCAVNGQPVPIAWPDQAGADCQHQEYGNPFDPMGGGQCFHMNGIQKAYQDWIGGCNVIKVAESGSYTIYPLESSCDGPQLLQIPFPQGRSFGGAGRLTSYYLELRAPIGRDARLSPRVLVTVANDVREARFAGNNNWLLDMTPETNRTGDEALPVGKLYEDTLPGGPKFKVVSADASKAVIEVEIGGQPAAGRAGKAICSDGKTEHAPTASVRCVAPAAQPTPPGMPTPGGSDGGATAGDAGVGDAGAGRPGAGPIDAQTGNGGGNSSGGNGGSSNGSGGAGSGGSSGGGTLPGLPLTPPAPAAKPSSSGCQMAPEPMLRGSPSLLFIALASLLIGLAARRKRPARGS